MRRIRQIVTVATLVLALTSCVSFHHIAKHAQDIEAGMTKEEVKRIMGRADYRSFSGDSESWEYRKSQGCDYGVIVVHFINGRVTTMESFLEMRPNFPEQKKDKSISVKVGQTAE